MLKKFPYNLWLVFCFLLLAGCGLYTEPQSPLKMKQHITPHYLSFKNGHIEYFQFGHGTPIILIAGYATGVSSWNRQLLTSLAQHHRVIVFNNSLIAGTDLHHTHYTAQALAEDTYLLIKKLQLKKPAILGISMGGMIAQELALLHPQQLGELILINTAIAGDQAIHPQPAIEKSLRHFPKDKLGQYNLATRLFFPPDWQWRMRIALIRERFQPAHYVEKNVDPTTLAAQLKLIDDWSHDNAAAQKMVFLKMPILILNGKADIVIPPKNSDILAHTLAHATLVRWNDCGHAMTFQYPLAIAHVIDRFLEQQSLATLEHS